jgi:hypothetical protein
MLRPSGLQHFLYCPVSSNTIITRYMPFEVRPDVDPLVIFSGKMNEKNDNGEKLNMKKLESTKMEYINIIDKQNILYLSDYQKDQLVIVNT